MHIQVTVRFTGLLRSMAGAHSLNLSLEQGATLRHLLHTLRDTLPPLFVAQVVAPLETDEAPLALLLLNRKHVQVQDRLDLPLHDGDVVAFVMPMAGGC